MDLALAMTALAIAEDPLADWDWAFFPLLFLPVELLVKILHNLPVADRLRVRVCRKLREIEGKEQFKISTLVISYPEWGNWQYMHQMMLQDTTKPYSDGLRKITSNNTISSLAVVLNESYKELFDIVINITTICFTLHIEGLDLSRELLTMSAIEKLISVEGRLEVSFCSEVPAVTASLLLKIYQDMQSGATRLVSFNCYKMQHRIARSFLASLGLHVDVGRYFVSTNPHIQVFLRLWGDYVISIGDMMIFVETKIYAKGEVGHVNIRKIDTTMDVKKRYRLNLESVEELQAAYELSPPLEVEYGETFDEEGNEEHMMPTSRWELRKMSKRYDQMHP